MADKVEKQSTYTKTYRLADGTVVTKQYTQTYRAADLTLQKARKAAIDKIKTASLEDVKQVSDIFKNRQK